MARPLGTFAMRRPHRLNGPILAMVLNAVHDHHGGRVFVLQVGAGTGDGFPELSDRLGGQGWSGLLIEPHPRHFATLEDRYRSSDNVAVLNLGISDVAATLPLHALTEDAAARHPKLAPHRASLIRNRLQAPGLTDADIDSVELPFLRLDSVLGELGLDTAQLVVINAGGHEEQVLRSFDLATFRPTAVLVRSQPGTAPDDAIAATLAAADLTAYRNGGWLMGLAPGLTVPLDDLLSFFNRGLDQTEVEE